jgi:hypothetical protein
MRDAAAIRQRLLKSLEHSTRRPGMHATSGHEYELFAWYMLGDLCFIDERDDDFDRLRRSMLHRHGSLGVAGAFTEWFGESSRHTAEVTSVYAQAGAQLGLLDVHGRLTRESWDALAGRWGGDYDGRDRRVSEVIGEHGEPSLTIDRRVLCYVGPGDDDWIVFDCWEPWVERYDANRGTMAHHRPEDPLLRDVRIPAPTFAESLVLTRYGKLLHRRHR